MLFFIIVPLFLLGQDPNFSQFNSNSLYYNPAYTGIHGGTRASMTYRRQYYRMPSYFKTYKFSFDTDLPEYKGLGGIGIMAVSDLEGDGFIRTQSIGLYTSVKVVASDNLTIFNGYKIDFIQKSIDWNNLVFSDELDQIDGPIYETSFIAPQESKIIFPDISVGLAAKYETSPNKSHRNNNIFKIGVSAHHITQPDQSLIGVDSKLSIRYVIHANANLTSKKLDDFVFAPGFYYQIQNEIETFSVGCIIYGKYPIIGTWYRSQNFNNGTLYSDALVFIVGTYLGNYRNMKLSYSYDTPVSDLVTSVGSTHEICLTYFSKANILKGKSSKGKSGYKRMKLPEF